MLLKRNIQRQIPPCINYFIKAIDLALTREIPFTSSGSLNDIYLIMFSGKPSFEYYQTAIEAVSWLMSENVSEAGDLSFQKI